MNRERTNVGRTAYSDRVKSMLLVCESTDVASSLIDDLKNYKEGTLHDEVNWIDVQEQAVKTLAARSRVLFLTSEEGMRARDMVGKAKMAGIEIVTIPERLKERIGGQVDIEGKSIRDLNQFYKEYHESFEFSFVDESDLAL